VPDAAAKVLCCGVVDAPWPLVAVPNLRQREQAGAQTRSRQPAQHVRTQPRMRLR